MILRPFVIIGFVSIAVLSISSGEFASAAAPVDGSDQQKQQLPNALDGKKLFQREWQTAETHQLGEPDGLGPMFNADSCVACHHQGGVGGSGGRHADVQLLSVLPNQNSAGRFDIDENSLTKMLFNARRINPTLGQVNSMVLHRSSTNPRYLEWRRRVLELPKLEKLDDTEPDVQRDREPQLARSVYRVKKGDRKNRFTLQVTRRNTPSLFGVSQIESIPDQVIRAVAAEQGRNNKDVQGQVANLPGGGVGKFGWRGQIATVREFTAQACAVELGLTTSSQNQSGLPFRRKDDGNKAVDMNDLQLGHLVTFINSLEPPAVKLPSGPGELSLVKTGRKMFFNLRCAECHVERMGNVVGVYSDLLMHDMGDELSDAAGVVRFSSRSPSGVGGYFGPGSSSTPDGIALGNDRVWQTPPLWGIAQSAPYLHDGRANTLHQAIMLHAGEAQDSKSRYRRLSDESKRLVLKFLGTLGGK